MQKGKILVVGGAGYIGSHVNKLLNQKGYETVVFDNLGKGHKEAVKWGEFYQGNLDNIEDIRGVFGKYKIDAVYNFAAFIEVGESVVEPEKYYFNNLVTTLNLLKVMREFGVKIIIFSSTAATFGNPAYTPIDEAHSQSPINPYGKTKLMIENVFKDYALAYGLRFVVFRYFNACGASPDGDIGEWHEPESHLIPIVLQTASGKRELIKINGIDYPTADGTCVRDYIHVMDLASAHVLALDYLNKEGVSDFFNLGNGKGFSIKEVINTAKEVTGVDFKVEVGPRREGDPPTLIAESAKARKVLGWKPEYTDLKKIIETAWRWENNLKSE